MILASERWMGDHAITKNPIRTAAVAAEIPLFDD
jgi:hypothetical protein